MTYEEMKKMLDEMKHKKSLLRTVQRQIQETREQMNVISDFCHQNCCSMEKETSAAEKTKEKSNRRSGCDRIGVESDE